MLKNKTVTKVVGFSLMELVVVIAILGTVAIAIPRFMGRTSLYKRHQFIRNFGTLVARGWQRAISTGQVHKIFIDYAHKRVELQSLADQSDKNFKPQFTPVRSDYNGNFITWPKNFVLKNLIINGHDEVTSYGFGNTFKDGWFYISSSGIIQDVIINFLDEDEKVAGKSRPVSLVINPFTAQLTVYDSFKK